MAFVRINGDGSIETVTEGVPAALIEVSIREGIEAGIEKRLGASPSQGAAWLVQYRAQYQEQIARVDAGGDLGVWYVKKLSLEDIDEMATLMSGVCGFGTVDMSHAQSKSAFTRALLYTGTCVGPNDPARKFGDFDVATIFYQESRGDAPLLAGMLRDELLSINTLFGTSADEEGKKKIALLQPSDFG